MNSNRNSSKTIGTALVLLLIVFFVDRLTKFMVSTLLKDYDFVSINNYFNLTSVWNTGVGFGLMDSLPPLMLVFVSCFIAIYLLFLFIKKYNDCIVFALAISLMIGGAMGNVYDRLHYGAVYDFIDFHVKSYHWPTFNFADTAVTFGSILIVFSGFSKKRI
ncbi:signal peptidase II [Candidatus Xenohaliotis californiensis]|uniref:signal peptidase II n=1 Tax=Candidatus Xenohaliotis californiensis TaxID=84677 RepID=UPI0030C818E9